MFHEVWRWADRDRADVNVDRTVTERLFQDYFEPAGVSEKWLNHLRIMVQQSDYWQTGENLWADKSGIITDPLDNLVLGAPRRSDIELCIRAGQGWRRLYARKLSLLSCSRSPPTVRRS